MRTDNGNVIMTSKEYDDEYLGNLVKGYARGRLDADNVEAHKAMLIIGFHEFFMKRRYDYPRNSDWATAWDHYVMSLELLRAMKYR